MISETCLLYYIHSCVEVGLGLEGKSGVQILFFLKIILRETVCEYIDFIFRSLPGCYWVIL